VHAQHQLLSDQIHSRLRSLEPSELDDEDMSDTQADSLDLYDTFYHEMFSQEDYQ